MAAAERLPRFLIVGAVKAATTWISQQLRAHPLLWLPQAEPLYFAGEYHRGREWYAQLFADAPADRLLGEKSADYLAHPHAAERIARLLPDVPMIAQLRDPVDRAYSHYCMLFRRGMVLGDPRRYLDAGCAGAIGGHNRFLVDGLYARHLHRWQRHLPDAPLKVMLFEDVRDDPVRIIAEVCAHIGVPVHISEAQVAQRSNDSRAAMLPLPLRRMLRPMRPLLDPWRGNPLLARARSAVAQPVRYPPLTDELRDMLREYYREDVRELAAMLGRDLSGWCGGTAPAETAPRARELVHQGGQ